MTTSLWQPTLESSRLRLRPLTEADFGPLQAAASDPLIWEQHPDRLRHRPERFAVYFRSGLDSGGALAIHDRGSGALIGSSRFLAHDPAAGNVEIGYTFLTRPFWGSGHNRELKTLMLDHAFRHVATAHFVVGEHNLRSRRAMEKLGGRLIGRRGDAASAGAAPVSVVYAITRDEWGDLRSR